MSTTSDDSGEFHLDFMPSGAADEVVLISNDNTRFAVPMSALARMSPWFRTMFSLPQPEPSPTADSQPIAMPHSSETVQYIVAYACGFQHPALTSASQIDNILRAAAMYEMAGLLSIMHIALRNVPGAIRMSPIRRYVMARRHGMEDVRIEAEAACLTATLDMDVADDDFFLLKPVLMTQFNRMQDELKDLRAKVLGPSSTVSVNGRRYNLNM